MKTIMLRKPKFMRDEAVMAAYMTVASSMAKEATKTQDVEKQYEFLNRAGEYMNKASEAGGFFRTKDFFKWLDEK